MLCDNSDDVVSVTATCTSWHKMHRVTEVGHGNTIAQASDDVGGSLTDCPMASIGFYLSNLRLDPILSRQTIRYITFHHVLWGRRESQRADGRTQLITVPLLVRVFCALLGTLCCYKEVCTSL